MRTTYASLCLAAAAAAGCTSFPAWPKDEAAAVALVDAGPACSAVRGPPVPPDPNDQRADMTTMCIGAYPRFLAPHRISGTCAMFFDLDPAGVPTNRHFDCKINGSETMTPDVIAVANAAMVRASERALMETRYTPADPSRPDERRTNYKLDSTFEIRQPVH